MQSITVNDNITNSTGLGWTDFSWWISTQATPFPDFQVTKYNPPFTTFSPFPVPPEGDGGTTVTGGYLPSVPPNYGVQWSPTITMSDNRRHVHPN